MTMAKSSAVDEIHGEHLINCNEILVKSSRRPSESDARDVSLVTDESDADNETLFSPIASDAGTFADEEGEEELDLDWYLPPPYPKRFLHKPVSSEPQRSSSLSDDLEDIICETTADIDIPINKDFWKDVDSSVTEMDFQVPCTLSPPLPQLSSNIESKYKNSRIEDFITTDNSTNCEPAEITNTQFMYPIKKLTFRDSDGKLALDPSTGSAFSHNRVSKPANRMAKFKKLSRTKSGWCEMVSTGIGISEFMLL